MVGGMGHANSVATGISLNNNNQVICLDGDGSLLMHFDLYTQAEWLTEKITNIFY